jgi:glutathione S-transferase
MSKELIFYSNPMSRSRIVRWMLEEIGQPYKTEIIEFGPSMKSPDYLAINPMGKVPAIKHGDMVITECAAICTYLADVFPQAHLAPPHENALRGSYYRWLFFAAGPMEAAVTNKAFGFVVPPERKGSMGYGSYEDVLNTLEKVVSQTEYLVGSSFTAADLYVGSHLNFGMQFGTVEKRPAFVAYNDRLKTRPAAQRATQIDDQSIAQRTAAKK